MKPFWVLFWGFLGILAIETGIPGMLVGFLNKLQGGPYTQPVGSNGGRPPR